MEILAHSDKSRKFGCLIESFGHAWECWLPAEPEFVETALPPPFAAFGAQARWKLHACRAAHDGKCESFTVKAAESHVQKSQQVLKNYNLLFGVTRNKKLAVKVRVTKTEEDKRKKVETESESESEESESDSDESEDSEDSADKSVSIKEESEDESVDESDA